MLPRRPVLALAALAAPLTAQTPAPFDAPRIVVGDRERIDHLADLDQDGDLDAFGWFIDVHHTKVHGWFNDGSGNLTRRWTLQRSERDYGGAPFPTGDVDADGRIDFFLVINFQVFVYRTRGLAVPALRASWDEGGEVAEAVSGDFDGDGLADLVTVVELADGSFELRGHRNLGGGSSFQQVSARPLGARLPRLAVGELDGTPGDELVLAQRRVRVLGMDTASFGPVLFDAVHGLPDGAMPVVGDVDGDGRTDVTLFHEAEERYALLRAQARPVPAGPTRGGLARARLPFALEAPRDGGPASDLCDVDGDGDLDGVCCGGGSVVDNREPSIFRVSLNDGTGRFGPAWALEGLGARWLAGAADVNADGLVDLVAGRTVYLAARSLAEAPHPALPAAPARPGSLWDADGDGDLDVAVGPRTGAMNTGDGTFVAAELAVAAPPGTTFEGPGFPVDLDGDGDTDLVVSHLAGESFVSMRRLVNAGGGVFVDGGPAGAPGADFNYGGVPRNDPEHALVADFDDDGDLDLLVHRRSASFPWTRVWTNDGTGFFTAGMLFDDGNVVVFDDLTGDGLPDAATFEDAPGGSSGAAVLHVHAGLGNGLFAAPYDVTSLRRYHHLSSFVAADFDQDGDLDLGTRDQVILNDGTGAFPTLLDLGFNVPIDTGIRVTAGDVNGDGWPDHLLSPTVDLGPGGVKVSLWNPLALAFDAPLEMVLADGVLGDLDGDGDLDLVGDRTIRNRTVE